MIRIGPSSSGVTHRFNSFHSTSTQTTGFYCNVTGGGPPPPGPLTSVFGSSSTEPWYKMGSTTFVDPYQITSVPTSISKFYFDITYTNIGAEYPLKVTVGNAYDGVCNQILPDGKLEGVVSTLELNKLYGYIRLNSTRKTYRFFHRKTGVGLANANIFVLLGPENVSSAISVSGGFTLDGLKKVTAAQVYYELEGSDGTYYHVSKDEAVPVVDFWPDGLVFEEVPLSGTYSGGVFCLFLFYR